MKISDCNFYRELSRGNIVTAYNYLFTCHEKLSQFDQTDAIYIFLKIIRSGAYHSATACEKIRVELQARYQVSQQQQNILREIDIPEPRHPGVIFPSITDGGHGILFYVTCNQNISSHLYKCQNHALNNSSQIVFQQILHVAETTFLQHNTGKSISRYHLKPPGIPSKYQDCTVQETTLESASLAIGFETILSELNKTDHQTEIQRNTILTTGCWDTDHFIAADALVKKIELLKREFPELTTVHVASGCKIPEISPFENIKEIKTIHEILETIGIHHPSQATETDKYLYLLRKKVKKLSSNDDETLRNLDKIHQICQIDIPSNHDLMGKLAKIILKAFKIMMKNFHFDDALQYAQRLEKIIQANPKELETTANQFYPNYCELLTSLYEFDAATDFAKKVNFSYDTPENLSLFACLLADCALLRGDLTLASTHLERAESFQIHKRKSRCQIYRTRIQLTQDPANAEEILHNLENNKPTKDHDLAYWYYVWIRSLIVTGRNNEAMNSVLEAEDKFYKQSLYTWPGILWRRHGAIAAEKLGNLETAQKLLQTPLPDSLQDRFILKTHKSASELLWWAMTLAVSDHESAGSPEFICKPLRHPLISHYFKDDINNLLDDWKQRISRKILRKNVETIVRKTYE